MMSAFERAFWGPANLASNVVSLVTIAAAVFGFLFMPSLWFVIAAIGGLVAAVVLLWVGNDRYRVFELIQWMRHKNALDWDPSSNQRPVRDEVTATLWLESPASANAEPWKRSDALRTAGYIDSARAELDAAQPATALEYANTELSRFEADFYERGDGDLGPLRAAAADLTGDDERVTLAHVAYYEAVMDHAAGRDWFAKLRYAQRELRPFNMPLGVRANPIILRTIIPVGFTIFLIAVVSWVSDLVTELWG